MMIKMDKIFVMIKKKKIISYMSQKDREIAAGKPGFYVRHS